MKARAILTFAIAVAVLVAAAVALGSGSGASVACRYRIDDLCLDVTPAGSLEKVAATRTASIEMDSYAVVVTQTGREPQNLLVVRDDSIGAPLLGDRDFTERRIMERRPGGNSKRLYRLYPADIRPIGASICRPGPSGFRCAEPDLVCFYDDNTSGICRERPSARFYFNSLRTFLGR